MEDRPDNMGPDNPNPWNKREKKSSIFLYLAIAAVCLILAYVVSGAAK